MEEMHRNENELSEELRQPKGKVVDKPEEINEFPKVNRDKCTLCYHCISACPVSLFEEKDGKAAFIVPRKLECVHCRACEMGCPVNAITMEIY
eukprot:TRINITY_DN1161_c0_g1_i4.p2 TRINITY_DN1161_c0_g1~~TRINITY_DN1161_c0_g1_i4.p2  ORF type:complete len:107 (-),score=39.91 TRINITY_DN1161_c0_g1_i4:68-346(-)